MQMYNQINQGNIMPLLMNFTSPSLIQENGINLPPIIYNDGEQITYEMSISRTYCKRECSYNLNHKTRDYRDMHDDNRTIR